MKKLIFNLPLHSNIITTLVVISSEDVFPNIEKARNCTVVGLFLYLVYGVHQQVY